MTAGLKSVWPGIRTAGARIPNPVITGLVLLLAAGILGVRVYHCAQMPAHTGDISRHLFYGLLVDHLGLGAARYPLTHFNPGYAGVAWSGYPYNYPAVTLFFFSLVTWISPTLFFARLCLTLLEAASSLLIWVTSRERWLALLYWASPVSIWWSSREGQFEALQSFFVFLAFALLKQHPMLACAALALAVQVKLTAILLVPLFAVVLWSSQKGQIWKSGLGFLAGWLPTGIALCFYPALEQLKYSAPLVYNPYFWNITAKPMFAWNTPWMIWANQIGSYGMLSLLVLGLILFHRQRLAYLAPILFLIACKWHKNVQFWYMVLFPSFVFPIADKRFRWALFLLSPALDLYSAAMLLYGPLYLGVGSYYGSLTPFTPFRLL